MVDTTLQIRTNAADKEAAGKVLAEYGVNYSQLVNALLREVIRTESVPFAVNLTSAAVASEKKQEEKKAEMPVFHARQELSLDELDMVAAAGDGTSVESSVEKQLRKLLEKGYTAAMIQKENPKLYQKARELGLL